MKNDIFVIKRKSKSIVSYSILEMVKIVFEFKIDYEFGAIFFSKKCTIISGQRE